MTIITQDSHELLISQEEISEIQMIARISSEDMTNRKIATVLGVLNHYAWRLMTNAGVIEKVECLDGDVLKIKQQIKVVDFKTLLLQSRNENLQIEVAQQSLTGYIKKFWTGTGLKAFFSVPTLGDVRDFCMNILGIFTFDQDRPKGGKWGNEHGKSGEGVATPPIFEQVDLVRIILFYRELSKILRGRIDHQLFLKGIDDKTSFDFMPEHGGALMIEAFNIAFFPLHEFYHDNVEQFPATEDIYIYLPETEQKPEVESPVNLVRWKWRKFKKMSKQIWVNLVVKCGQICDDLSVPMSEPPVVCPNIDDMMQFVPY